MSICRAITTNLSRSCKGAGGVKRFLVLENEYIVSYSATGSTGVMDDMTLSGSTHFWEYVPTKQSSSFSEKCVTTNSSLVYEQTMLMVFSKLEASKRLQIRALCESEICVIAEDFNGNYWIAGYQADNGMELTEMAATTGVAESDANSYTITLVCRANEPALNVSASIIAGLLD